MTLNEYCSYTAASSGLVTCENSKGSGRRAQNARHLGEGLLDGHVADAEGDGVTSKLQSSMGCVHLP